MSRADVLKGGRAMALCSQLLLLALAAGALVLMMSSRTPDAAALQWLSLFGALQVLPVIVLALALFCRARWAPWFGMAATVVVLGLQMTTLGLDSSWLAIAQAVLWTTTGVGLLAEIAFVWNQQSATATGALKAFLFAGLGLGLALLPMAVMMACLFAATRARGGAAPDTDFASRRAWGERVFGPYLTHIDAWVAESEIVAEDIGDVLKIAPIDGPNRFQSGFTDGAYAVMNLEVIGGRGKGVLYLPYVEIWNTGRLHSIGRDATWKFAGRTEYVAKSGKSYLAEYGLETIYSELLELAARGDAEQFVARWNDLETALAKSGLESPSRFNRTPQPIAALHDAYRDPMLAHFGAALAKLDRKEASATVYRDSAATILTRAEYLLQKQDKDRQLARVAEQLRQANALLSRADAQVPDHQETLKLARERVVLQHLLSIGGRPRAGYGEDNSLHQAWAEKCLGIFYTEAAEYAKQSPYLHRQLGRMRIRIDSDGRNQLQVNQHNVYSVSVDLRLEGRRDNGSLNVRIRENHERCAPIDLFADAPRSPDYPLVIRSPYWKAEGQERVKLSAKTGEPLGK